MPESETVGERADRVEAQRQTRRQNDVLERIADALELVALTQPVPRRVADYLMGKAEGTEEDKAERVVQRYRRILERD